MHHSKLFFYVALLCLIALSSCSRKIYYQEAYLSDENSEYADGLDENITDNPIQDVIIKTSYSGDAFQYVVFEIDIDNRSSEDLLLSIDDITFAMQEDRDGYTYDLKPLDKSLIIADLKNEQRSVKSERKTQNVLNAVGVGASLLSIFVTPGADIVNTAIYATDATVGVLETDRAYRLVEGDIDDQILYISEWVLGDELIKAGENISFDLLFDRRLTDAQATMIIDNNQIQYDCSYTLRVMEGNMR